MENFGFSFKFESFGTVLEIKIFESVSKILEEKIKSEVYDFTVFFDDNFSRFKKDNLIGKISKNVGKFSVPKMLVEMLRLYEKFSTLTGGKMNPLIGNTISDLGYDANYTLKPKKEIRQTPLLQESLEIISDSEIALKQKMLIDIGALGKGFWVDEVRKILERNNIYKYLIDGSGDIYFSTSTNEKIQVGLENENADGIIGTTPISNESICGSGIHKRNWSLEKSDNLHHVLDAKTGRPTEGVLSVWVKAKSCALADGLATALFLVEDKEILREKVREIFDIDFEYLIVKKDEDKNESKKILVSKNFDANLF